MVTLHKYSTGAEIETGRISRELIAASRNERSGTGAVVARLVDGVWQHVDASMRQLGDVTVYVQD